MNYPLIGQYTETIKLAAKTPEVYFEKLNNLRPEPVMSSGNFAVVFKMRNVQNGRFFAENVCHDDTILLWE